MFTSIVSRFAAKAAYSDLSDADIAAAKRGVIDCLGAALAGSREEVTEIVKQRARETKGHDEATIINGGFKADTHIAAFVNATMGHALDYDDVIHAPPLWMGHPSVVILPAVLAMAEKTNASGKDLILAYCVGIEIYATIGLLCGDRAYKNGWHNTSFIGTMAAAGATAKVLKLDEGQIRRCFGIAGSMAGGLRQNFGTMMKPVHAGISARNGVEAALLAKAGLSADETIFEASLGFRNVFTAQHKDISAAIPYGSEELTPDELAARLGNPWRISHPGLSFKLCPSCRGTHFAMEAALEFKQARSVDPAQIVEIECHVPREMGSVLFYHRPEKGLEGKFSLEYVLARTLLDGAPKISDFTDERVNEPAVKQLIEKVKWFDFEPANGAVFGAPEFIFKMSDGQEFRLEVEHLRGEPENPVDDAFLIEKFQDCAGLVMGAEARNRIKDVVFDLPNVKNVVELTDLLRPS